MEVSRINTFKKPKILLLGNGINRAFAVGDVSWTELLKAITMNKEVGIELDRLKNEKNHLIREIVPLPLEIVLRTDDNVNIAVKNAKENLYGALNNDEQKNFLRKILSAGFDCILTTNYSYELEMASLKDGVKLTDTRLKNIQKHTNPEKRAEAKYLLHTYNSVDYNGVQNQIWHIHGEARKPNSMIIGHYYYGNLLFKYKELLTKRRNSYHYSQENADTFEIKSWLDAFILGDVYILGFGMDFSEIDLWWLINRKKREKALHGEAIFYEPTSDGFNMKKKLLVDYDVTVKNLGYSVNENCKIDYKNFYQDALADIEEQIIHNHKEETSK